MYNFLYTSLTDEAKLMVLSDYSDYLIIAADGSQICNGPCFFKVIIRNTTVDTRSTVFHIRENLNHLKAKILEISYDIEAFNLRHVPGGAACTKTQDIVRPSHQPFCSMHGCARQEVC
jgi:hypothetical protein